MALPFLEQQFHYVHVKLRRLRQRHLVRCRRISCWFPHSQLGSFSDRHDVGYWGIAVENGKRFSPLHAAKEFAELRFQFRYPDLLHDHMRP